MKTVYTATLKDKNNIDRPVNYDRIKGMLDGLRIAKLQNLVFSNCETFSLSVRHYDSSHEQNDLEILSSLFGEGVHNCYDITVAIE